MHLSMHHPAASHQMWCTHIMHGCLSTILVSNKNSNLFVSVRGELPVAATVLQMLSLMDHRFPALPSASTAPCRTSMLLQRNFVLVKQAAVQIAYIVGTSLWSSDRGAMEQPSGKPKRWWKFAYH
jgi:hypothetical protein